MDRLSSMRVKNGIEKSEVVAGDHIYSWRPLFVYSHHGIYIGDGLVIHFTAPPEKLKATTSRKGSLYRYVYGVTEFQSRHQLRGGTCTPAQSDPESTVLQRTNYLFENGFGNYNLVKNNCEDFAFYCKTGILTLDDKGRQISGQIAYLARMFPKAAEKYFSISKEAVEERLRNNGTEVIKVPVEDMDKFHRDGQSDAN